MNKTIQATTITPEIRQNLRGKRLAALDYGQKRIGFAVADELHILASPRGFFHNTPRVFEDIRIALHNERIGGVVVGMPIQHNNSETPMMQEILRFITTLQSHIPEPISVLIVDEAYSSREAVKTMVAAHKKKRHRAQKGTTDEVAAALILRDFLEELGL